MNLLSELNAAHRMRHPEEQELDARIANFELAGRMPAFGDRRAGHQPGDAGDAPPVRPGPGADAAVWPALPDGAATGGAWRALRADLHGGPAVDTHNNNAAQTRNCCEQTDLPVAGLLTDLQQRGLLDTTLVFWGGEFGRTPGAQNRDGRDHHPYGFSVWLAGGGIKGGQTYGATDDFGYRAVVDRCSTADLHATMLHLLGWIIGG